MSNGARHTWGFFIGVVLTAALAGLLIFGSYRLQHGYAIQFHKQDKWIGGGLIAAAGLVFALLASSRISPLGSLIGGLILTAAGVVFFISQKTAADLINRFPFKQQRVTLAGIEEEGFLLYTGVALLFASFFPSRWRAREASDDGYEYGVPQSSGADYLRPEADRRTTRDEPAGYTGTPYIQDSGETAHGRQEPVYGGQEYASQETNYESQRTNYDAPLYEQPRPQQPYSSRPPFTPPDEDGGTREMRRD